MLAVLHSHTDLISSIERFEHRTNFAIEQYKAVARLIDGTTLHINEVWHSGQLKKYAYYWVSPTGTVLQGWDNAPHHSSIATHPHHTHIESKVFGSGVNTLEDVLAILTARLL